MERPGSVIYVEMMRSLIRGRSVAHRHYFYGVRVQVVTTEEGVPVEFAFLPGAASDVRGLALLPRSLPEGSELFMDSGYTDYAAEDTAREEDGVVFAVQRRRDLRRRDEPLRAYDKQLIRKRVETTFSQITNESVGCEAVSIP